MELEAITRQEQIIAGKDLQPVTRMEFFLKAYGGGGSGGGAQPDWNQNNDTQPDYVKNRPFYTGDPVETVLVEESTVSFAESSGLYMAQIQSNFEATVGETYKVSWDGTAYECACVYFNGNTVIGNLSIVGAGSDTGEPFVMNVGNGINILTADTSASHTFYISCTVTPIVKIPAKYIDKNASGYIVVHNSSTMTEEEAENYHIAISKIEVGFIIWGRLYIQEIQLSGETNDNLELTTPYGAKYSITKNNDGLFNLNDKKFLYANLPFDWSTGDDVATISARKNEIWISPSEIYSGVGKTDALFRVKPNGTESKWFEVLGNGEAVAPAIILYSSTADSTKKFRITVDDSGTISATEVT